MQDRKLTILGTSSQVPTRSRNHIGCFLHWDKEGMLFDPGEGTQRQLVFAGISASEITKICITHFHGDHCLGLPGVIQRLSLERVQHPVEVYYPASGRKFYKNLLEAAIFHKAIDLQEVPIDQPGTIFQNDELRIESRQLDHGADTWGYCLKEHDSRNVLPHLLPGGISGQDIGRLKKDGVIFFNSQTINLEQVSVPKTGQSLAFVMDTRICPAAKKLAQGVDVLICESTYLSSESYQAQKYCHLTAEQAASIAMEAGAKQLVLLHFSQRYVSTKPFFQEASNIYPNVIIAEDGQQIIIPRKKRNLG